MLPGFCAYLQSDIGRTACVHGNLERIDSKGLVKRAGVVAEEGRTSHTKIGRND